MAECLEADEKDDERELGLNDPIHDYGRRDYDFYYIERDIANTYIQQFAVGFTTGRGWMLYGVTDEECLDMSRGYVDGMVARAIEPDTSIYEHLEKLGLPRDIIDGNDIDKYVEIAPMCNELIDTFTTELASSVARFVRDELDLYNEFVFELGDMLYDRMSLASGSWDSRQVQSPFPYMIMSLQYPYNVYAVRVARGIITPVVRAAYPDFPWNKCNFDELSYGPMLPQLDESNAITRRAEITTAYMALRCKMTRSLIYHVLLMAFGKIPVAQKI